MKHLTIPCKALVTVSLIAGCGLTEPFSGDRGDAWVSLPDSLSRRPGAVLVDWWTLERDTGDTVERIIVKRKGQVCTKSDWTHRVVLPMEWGDPVEVELTPNNGGVLIVNNFDCPIE